MRIKFLATAVIATSMFSIGLANAQSVEPTQSEMQKAVESTLKEMMEPAQATLTVISFEKNECEAAQDKAGAYVCTFTAAMDVKAPNAPESDKTPIKAKGLFEKNKDGAWDVTPM